MGMPSGGNAGRHSVSMTSITDGHDPLAVFLEKSAMKNRVWKMVLVCTMAGLLSSLSACGKSCSDKEKNQPGPAQERPAASAAARSNGENSPRLGLMVNRLSAIDTYPGWPLLVELRIWHPRLYHPEAKTTAIQIASSKEHWTDAIRLDMQTGSGSEVKVQLKPVWPDEKTLTLDERKTGVLAWWLSAEDTALLSEGDYRLIASLHTETVSKPGAWRGETESNPVIFHLKKEPSPLTAEQAEEKLLLLAACARASGEMAKAKDHVDALLAAAPESLQGLLLKAGLLEAEDDKRGAFRTIEKALFIFQRKYPDAEPPYQLWTNHKRLLAQLLKNQ